MRPNYLVIPLVAALTAYLGGLVTSSSIGSGWYATIARPAWTPGGSVIGTVWTALFAMAAASALLAWNSPRSAGKRGLIAALFLSNAVINFSWSAVFFGLRSVGPAVLVSVLLEASVIALILVIRPISRYAAILLVPYAAWVAFATFLNYSVWRLN